MVREKMDKCLYKCESITDGYEYSKLAKYFPKRIYWVYIKFGTLLNLVITGFISLLFKNWIISLIFFVLLEIYIFIYYKTCLESVTERFQNNRIKKGMAEASGENEFYEDYIIISHKKSSVTINYSEISRCVETDTNFYLEYPNKNIIIILQKNKCDLELINFIRSKFKNLENNLGDSSNFKELDNFKNTDNTLSISYFITFLFILTIGSLWGALWSYSLIDELNPQHAFNFLKNTWIFWCWLPIPIASIVLGFKYKNKGINCTKNIVGGFIIGFLLLIYGTFCLIPTFNEDYGKINDYKNYIDANIPSSGELEIHYWGNYFDDDKKEYSIINVYYDKEDVSDLVSSIENSKNWILSTKIKSELKILLPSQFRAKEDLYYSVYNKTINEYNTIPNESGVYEIYAMRYDKTKKELTIHKYKLMYNK